MLILIIKEVLWTIIKFLGRQEFKITSFLIIGVISAIRRLLYIEASLSTSESHDVIATSIEIGVTTMVVFVLILSYYILKRAEKFS